MHLAIFWGLVPTQALYRKERSTMREKVCLLALLLAVSLATAGQPRPCPGPGPCPVPRPKPSPGPDDPPPIPKSGSWVNGVTCKGLSITCDLPNHQQMKNIGSKLDGAGMCVFTSIEHAA